MSGKGVYCDFSGCENAAHVWGYWLHKSEGETFYRGHNAGDDTALTGWVRRDGKDLCPVHSAEDFRPQFRGHDLDHGQIARGIRDEFLGGCESI